MIPAADCQAVTPNPNRGTSDMLLATTVMTGLLEVPTARRLT
jgi:hypothetical protein